MNCLKPVLHTFIAGITFAGTFVYNSDAIDMIASTGYPSSHYVELDTESSGLLFFNHILASGASIEDLERGPDGSLYASTGSGTSSIYIIDEFNQTESPYLVPGFGAFYGLEFIGETLYGTINFDADGPSSLAIIDLSNPALGFGAIQFIGSTGFNEIGGLAYDELNDTLYGVTQDASGSVLLTIDINTGIASPVGSGTGFASLSALEYGSDGVLYAGVDKDGAISNPDTGKLIEIDPSTGLGTVVGDLGYLDDIGITGLANVLTGNLPPEASDDGFIVDEDSFDNYFDVLTNDFDENEDDILVITSVGETINDGVVTIVDEGSGLLYTPFNDFVGTDTFTYAISDGNGGTDIATVTIDIDNVNDNPEAIDDSYSVDEDSVDNLLPVLINDSIFPDTDESLTILSVDNFSKGGSATISADGTTLLYTPAPDYASVETFTYTITDGNGGYDIAVVTVNVVFVDGIINSDPEANDDFLTVDEDTFDHIISLTANDSSLPDEDEVLTIAEIGVPSHGGSVQVLAGSTQVSYTPAPDFYGIETFDYTLSDGNGGFDSAQVIITVNNVNDLPLANPDVFEILEGSGQVFLDIYSNDTYLPDPYEPIAILSLSSTASGAGLVLDSPTSGVLYTPLSDDFYGSDTFTYVLTDDKDTVDTGEVSITVIPVNDQPSFQASALPEISEDSGLVQIANFIADTDTGSSNEADQTLSYTVANVSDPELFSQLPTVSSSGTLSFETAPNANGSISFEIYAQDNGGTLNGGVDTSEVQVITFVISSVNDAPVANDDSVETTEDTSIEIPVLNNDTDVDGDILSIVSFEDTTLLGGTVVISGNQFFYTPPADASGVDSFGYTISDASGETSSATVTINILAVNDDPIAVDDEFSVDAFSVDNVLDVLANDSVGPETDEVLTLLSFSDGSEGGSIEIVEGNLIYTPASDFTGVESFSYTVSDGNGGEASANVSITVSEPVPDCGCDFLIPMALHRDLLENLSYGDIVSSMGEGYAPGNFTWLTWTGDQSDPTLATSLTPNGDAYTYQNPLDPSDHSISIGDPVISSTGQHNSRAVRNALESLQSLELCVVVWDDYAIHGKHKTKHHKSNAGNTYFNVLGFAKIRIVAYHQQGKEKVDIEFLGFEDDYCSEIPEIEGNDDHCNHDGHNRDDRDGKKNHSSAKNKDQSKENSNKGNSHKEDSHKDGGKDCSPSNNKRK